MSSTPISLAALLLVVALAYAVRKGADQDAARPGSADGGTGWFLSPASAQPDRVFSLRLLSERYCNCWTAFEHARLGPEGRE